MQGIHDEMGKAGGEIIGIDLQCQIMGMDLADIERALRILETFDREANECIGRHRHGLEAGLARGHFSIKQKIIERCGQAPPRGQDMSGKLFQRRIAQLTRAHFDHLGIAEDTVERGAKIMAHRGHDLAFRQQRMGLEFGLRHSRPHPPRKGDLMFQQPPIERGRQKTVGPEIERTVDRHIILGQGHGNGGRRIFPAAQGGEHAETLIAAGIDRRYHDIDRRVAGLQPHQCACCGAGGLDLIPSCRKIDIGGVAQAKIFGGKQYSARPGAARTAPAGALRPMHRRAGIRHSIGLWAGLRALACHISPDFHARSESLIYTP